MSNMSYCRFENTASDLEDCLEHINDKLSNSEHESRIKLIELCKDIIDTYDQNDNENEDDSEDD